MLRHNSEYLPVPDIEASPTHDERAKTVDLREIARILLRRWHIIGTIAGALTLAALIFVISATTQYTATSTILVDPRRANVVDTTQAVLTNFGTDDATIESQVLLIKSVAILRRVVERMKLAEDEEFVPPPTMLGTIKRLLRPSSPSSGLSAEEISTNRAVDALQQRLKVVRQGTTFLVDVNVNSESPAKAADIANKLAEAYFEEQVRAKYEATRIAAGWLSGQIENLKKRVTLSEKAVEDFRSANNLTVSQGVTVNDQQITDLNNRLIDARVQTAEARAKFDQIQQMAKAGGDPGAMNAAISSDIITKLRTQYADIAKSRADLSARYGERHPLVANVRAQLQDTQRLINDEIRRIVESTRHDYDVALSRETSLQKSFEELQGVSNTSNQALIQLHELRREAEANRTQYESYLARYKETSAQETLEMPDSRVVTKASIPINPSFPKSTLIVGLALALGLGIGSAAAFLVDYLDRRVKTLDDAAALLGVPALAAVPLVDARDLAGRAKRGREMLGRHDPTATGLLPPPLQPPLMRYAIEEPASFFAESIRAIRLAIQRALRIKPVQIILVTSAIDNEGKTTVAVNLALSLATLGIRTLLVDCDMRNPETTRSLCPRARTGLLHVALGNEPIERAILVDRSSGLSVLPAPVNAYSHATSELMFSDKISAVFEHLRQRYELIILDCPPLLPLVDGRALAEQADQIVLALAWDKTPRDAALDAVDMLAPVHDRILGTVLTRVDLHRLRHYDYYSSSAYIKPYTDFSLRRGAAL
ncbi:AAA family ATPase [Bradyrhizobium sp. LHD-71]|uniref:GumC family protein n=1 Tax=Bradyrhizobium sp. LHD-71 TaxID=3072141 RepID=UPI00280E03DA|nr:AAA family ATPase [Bradyrhizobium sp. LHD-71]MDQ8729773.1 AAA family ATPase [Bradyrhizobium sp. LHD-71]